MKYILASASPRRKELLALAVKDFEIVPSKIPEIVPDGLEVEKHSEYLAKLKANDIAKDFKDAVVIGADTSVILGNEILGKPKDREDAKRMLKMLSGNIHKVITGCAVVKNGVCESFLVTTEVEFFELTGRPISQQIEESKDKKSRYNPLMLMIDHPREYLYERIEKRVDIMLDTGLVSEVRKLSESGLKKSNLSMQGIGYKEILDYLRGYASYDEMVRIIKRDTRHYAKRQLTWFNRDKRIIKIKNMEQACGAIDEWRK